MIEIDLPILVGGCAALVLLILVLRRRRGVAGPWPSLAAVVLLVVAAAGVRVPSGGSVRTVRVVDVSWSMGDVPVPGLDELILFGRTHVLVENGQPVDERIRDAAGEDGSRLAGALRLAAAGEPAGEVVVVTDGRVEETGLDAAAAAVRANGGSIRFVPGGRRRDGDVRVTTLRLPGRVSAGAGVTAVATVEGPPGARVRVRLLVDGKPLQETEVALGVSGRAGVRFDVPARRSGRHVVTVAALPPPGDPCAANDRRSAGLVAIGARRAAVLNAQGLSKELSAGGWEVVDGLPADLADLDLLVVRDSPITAFEDHGEAVRRFVEGGGGLLVAGGTSCFGPGGWGGTPLEACLPVLSHPDGEGLFVAVLLDRSGTMADPFRPGGGAKFDAARRATEALVAVLPEGADLLVVPFAEAVLGEPRALPIADAASRAAARTRLEDAGRPSGGTMLAGPLLFTREALREVEAEKRLVLLFTDGRREGESASAVGEAAAALRNTGARVVCFAVGEDADRALLDELGGPGAAAVPVTEAGQVRDGFLRALFELQGKDRILRGEREVRATGAGGLPVVEPAPATDIVRTWAREGATIWHVTDEDAPVTAGRRYGLGRAVVSTADLAAMPGALTGALVEAAARPASLSAARFFVSADGRRLTAALDLDAPSASGFLVDAAGTRVPISFTATGPGTFEAAMPAAAPGAAWIDLAAPDGRVVRAGLSVPWPAEFRASGPDSVALEELSRRFGGGGVDGGDGSRDASPFLAGLALLLFLADRLKRGRPPVR